MEFCLTMFEDPGVQLPESIVRCWGCRRCRSGGGLGGGQIQWDGQSVCVVENSMNILSFSSWVALRALPDFISNLHLACLRLRAGALQVGRGARPGETVLPGWPHCAPLSG